MDDLRGYKNFRRGLGRLLARVPRERAPAGLAEEVLRRASEGPPTASWILTPRVATALAGAAAAALLALWAPWRSGNGAPAILEFKADRTEIRLGEPVTLTWKVEGASRVFLHDDRGMSFQPGEETSFTYRPSKAGEYNFVLVAFGPGGTSRRDLE